ncbi:MAG: leucyl aminopeptidase family protein [Candidatus Paceibacterota bacterium]
METKLTDIKKVNLKKGKFLFLPFFSDEKNKTKALGILSEISGLADFIKNINEGETRMFFSGKQSLIFLNIGEKKKWSQRKFLLTVRKMTSFLKENNIKEAVFFLEEITPQNSDLKDLSRQISENISMSDYRFLKYKEKPKGGWPGIKSIEIVWPAHADFKKDFEEGKIVGRIINFVRDLSNIPGGEMTPEKLALAAKEAVKKTKKISIEVFNKEKIKKLKMGGILGVSQGSSQEPKLIILKYFGRKGDKKIDLAFVGKGVTFDTGGLDIKPIEAMKDGMHMDMTGGAVVLGAILAIAEIKIPLNIVSIIPTVENMPSGEALRPGDILRAYNGKTIEIISPDAEGRIILADALSYATDIFKPKMIVDVATLTGAVLAALGQRAIGLFTNLSKMESQLREIGENSGDYVWPLPCWEEYEEEIKGTFGDIINSGKVRYGGAITAALFLKNFIKETPWVHLDIASTMTSIEGQGLAKGSIGSGTRYLIRLAQDFKDIENNL